MPLQTHPLGFAVLLSGALALSPALAQSGKAPAAAAKTETGYVVAVKENSLTLSNLPPAHGSGGGAPGGPQFSISREGKAPPGKDGAESSGGPGKVQLMLGPGDVVRGPDGKLALSPEARKRIPPDQQKKIEEVLNSSTSSADGRVVVQKGPGNSANSPPPGKAAAPSSAPSLPLQLTDFILEAKTRKPAGLRNGDKVKVTYTESGGKRIATRIEKSN